MAGLKREFASWNWLGKQVRPEAILLRNNLRLDKLVNKLQRKRKLSGEIDCEITEKKMREED